ncbi:uncharacterized protein LOC101241271 isoform X1 [Hydra vulgaris]|uniref:uncharacterized protein LOC101241271 isoform X1 n=1 Tax=Hydra vulgaris TaxID=6087 RepID=UPI001F5E3B7E|nr:uncharacterized protein LOC101241271 [Hydra vulgaris]
MEREKDNHLTKLQKIIKVLSVIDGVPKEIENLQLFEDCNEQVNKLLLEDDTSLTQFDSKSSEVVCVSLKALPIFFLFCKDANIQLEQNMIKQRIVALFKNTYQSLKLAISIVERWSFQFQDSYSVLANVLHSIIDSIKVLLYLDTMAAASICKSFKRLYTNQKNLVFKHVNDFEWLINIFDIVECIFQMFFQDVVQHNVKFYKFVIGLALQITLDFKDVSDDAIKKIYSFSCTVQRVLMKYTTQDLNPLLEATLKTCVKELLSYKNASPHFIKVLVSENNGLEHLILLSRFHSDLNETFQGDIPLHWFPSENRDSLIGLFFNLLQHFSPFIYEDNKILLPSSFGIVNVYEYLLVNLCSYMTNLPACSIQSVTDIIVSSLFISNITFIFAADLLSFIARWSSEDLCFQYVNMLGITLLKLGSMGLENTSEYNNIILLFKRLFLFLSKEQLNIKLFLKNHPFSQSIYLWVYIPIDKMKYDAEDINMIVDMAISVIHLNSEEQDGSERNVIGAIRVLCNISKYFLNFLSTNNQVTIVKEVVQFWSCFNDLDEDIEMSESVVIAMLCLASCVFHLFQPEQMLLVLSTVKDILLHCDNQSFRLQVTYFLSDLKSTQFHETNQIECLSLVASLFNYLLDLKDWMVTFFAMSALRDYAEVTIYSHKLSTFLPLTKKTDFTNFLQKKSKTHWSVLQQNSYEILQNNHGNQDIDSNVEQSVRECLDNISFNIEILRNYSSTISFPSNYQVEIEKMINLLSSTIVNKISNTL